MSKFIVMTSAAQMPASCMGVYRNVAVCEVDEANPPKMISERARGMVKIHHHYGPRHVGKTDRCEYAKVLAAAEKWAADLNKLRAGEGR